MPPPWTDSRPQLKPISAFSFSLTTPSRRRTPDRATSKDIKPKREPSATPLRTFRDARASHTSLNESNDSPSVVALSEAPVYPSPGPLPGVDYDGMVTPLRRTVFKKLETVPSSPFVIQPRTPSGRADRDESPGRPTQFRSLLDLTPIKHNDKTAGARHDVNSTHRALGELPARDMAEMLLRAPAKRKLDDDEIGVSPRGKRIIRWSGGGPLPVSVQLSRVLASATSSLQLFYTSYHSKLHPSSVRQIAKTSFTDEGVQPIDLLRTAPLQLRLTMAVKGPTHHATLVWGEVTRWDNGQTLGRSGASLKPDPDAPSVGPADHAREGSGGRAQVLVMFQSPPGECPRLGLDPRAVQQRMEDPKNRSEWEVGIWAPWSDVELVLPVDDLEAGEDLSLQEVAKMGRHKVVVASRYITVEKRS